jgi:hypothetical protein
MMFGDDDVIYRYTRAQALEDGVLVDAGPVAREAGFRIPVALTSAVWADCVEWSEKLADVAGQSERGRLWDVLWMAGHAARVHRNSGADRVSFSMLRIPKGGRRAERVELSVHIGAGDDGEPVATVMWPHED